MHINRTEALRRHKKTNPAPSWATVSLSLREQAQLHSDYAGVRRNSCFRPGPANVTLKAANMPDVENYLLAPNNGKAGERAARSVLHLAVLALITPIVGLIWA